MEIIYDINNCPHCPTAATIGSFDGVHRGHVAMIEETKRMAAEAGLPVTLITFGRHPRLLFDEEAQPFLLSSPPVRMERLAATGVERCVVLDFNRTMAGLTAEEFMSEVLSKRLNVKLLVLGYDHRFGRPEAGVGTEEYISYGHRLGMEVVRAARYDEGEMKVSSSQVRRALSAGDVERAGTLLGYRYSISGKVIHGAALGRRLGFPTANIELDEPLQLLPLNGVYEVEVEIGEKEFAGVINIGTKPTVTESGRMSVEVFIMDFGGDLYGKQLTVSFVRRIRDERKFASIDGLKQQIDRDIESVRENQTKA